jgi:hypothetical protein
VKTTLVIDDRLMQRLREEAARRHGTLSGLVDTALRLLLDSRPPRPALPPLPEFDGGGAWVDPANREALYSVMEEQA